MRSIIKNLSNDRGVSAIIVAIVLVVFLGIAALAVDVGYVAMAKNELQNTADASALAGARQLGKIYTDNVPLDQQQGALSNEHIALVKQAAMETAYANKVIGVPVMTNEEDVKIGIWDPSAPPESAFTETNVAPRAVRVTVYRNESTNGPIATFFGRFFGSDMFSLSVDATASLTPASTGQPDLPFAIAKDFFERGCDAPITWAGNADCAAWTTFSQQNTNANDLKGILACLNADGSDCIPETSTADSFLFSNGVVSTALQDMKDLFDKMKDESGTWTAEVFVVNATCGNIKSNNPLSIAGYATVTISEVNTTAKTIDATTNCNIVQEGIGGGTSYNSTLGSVPSLVQ